MPLIHANGAEMHYHLQGSGTPIVFLHPPCLASRVFTYMRNELAQDHRTLLFDFRGHGRSASTQSAITIPLLAEDVRRLVSTLDISSAYLCAYSVGTMVALEALLSYPEIFRGAVLLGGVAEVTGWKSRAKIKAGTIAGKFGAKELLSLPIAWSHADSRETFQRLRNETQAGDVAKWREYLTSAMHYSAISRLRNIRQPVLLVCGERDDEYKAYMRVLQQGLPNDSSAFIPDLKHTLPIFGADPISQLIRGWISAQEEANGTAEEQFARRQRPADQGDRFPHDQQRREETNPFFVE